MIHTKQKLISALVVSLLVAAISLSGTIAMAAVAPLVKSMPSVRETMITPTRMALDSMGNFWVADYRAKSLLKYNVYGHVVKEIKVSGNPFAITVRSNGSLVVTLGNYAAIVDPVSGVETPFGSGIISKGNGVAADENGQIYITDASKHKVHVFGPTGAYTNISIGGYGLWSSTNPNLGLFGIPTAIAYEKESKQIAVVDSLNSRIQFFDTLNLAGGCKRVIGTGLPLDQPVSFVNPQGLAFEYDSVNKLKRIYVVDTWKNAIQVLDGVSFSFLSLIGAGTSGSFQTGILGGIEDWQFILPTDAAIDPIYKRLFVVAGTSSVQVFGIDGGKSPSDNTPHFLTIKAAPLNTAQPAYTIEGTVKAGSEIRITSNTTAVAGAVRFPSAFGSTVAWAADISNLALGANVLTVTAVDVTGKVLTKEVTVVYGVPAPALAINTASGSYTNQAVYPISGTVDIGSTLTITNSSSGFTTTITPSGSAWTANVALAANAANGITVAAKKPGSNTATSTVTIINDNTPPTISLSALAEGVYASGQLQNISGVVQDINLGDTVGCKINGVSVAPAPIMTSGVFSLPAPLKVGENSIEIQAVDKAGNVSVANRKLVYDPTRTAITVTSPADNSNTAEASVTVSGSVNPQNAAVTVVNGTNGNIGNVSYPSAGTWSATVPAATGLNTVIVTATSAGVQSNQKLTVTYDPAKPVVAITSPSTDAYAKEASIVVAGSLLGGADGYPTLKAVVNSVPVADADITVDAMGHFSFPVVLGAASEEKVFSIQVTATDKAGSSTVVQRNIIHDNIAPNLTLDGITVPVPVVISGTVDASSTVSVKDGDTTFPVTYDYSGTPVKWTAQFGQAQYNPATVQIAATDPAGNVKLITGLNR